MAHDPHKQTTHSICIVKKVLVADDHGINTELAIAVLETMGYTGVAAKNGLEAVEKARAEAPDLILLDYTMPVLNGVEACRQIRQIEGLEAIPIFFLSGNDELKDRQTALRAGANDFLSKPFNEQSLREALWVYENNQKNSATTALSHFPQPIYEKGVTAVAPFFVNSLRRREAWVNPASSGIYRIRAMHWLRMSGQNRKHASRIKKLNDTCLLSKIELLERALRHPIVL